MILAIDTSTAACTAALFADDDSCVAKADELIGRGHAERLAPMLAEMLGDARPATVLVGVGPGSFTGIRVGVAAAHGLAIGWGARLFGLSSLALLAASSGVEGVVAAALQGGHGELFVQQFGPALRETTAILNLAPAEAAREISAETVVGPGAAALVEARGCGSAVDCWPSAATALRLPDSLRSLPPAPIYARAPDAKVKSAA
jgi:tRNA threonylcarbamoyl adenosine modification protein YeaZ